MNKALDIYKPPFTTDGVFIYASNGIMALMAINLSLYSDRILERVCQILNDEDTPVGAPKIGYDNGELYLNGDPFLAIRGWGYLTGIGGLNLPEDTAASIQDQFAMWVANKITGKQYMRYEKDME